MLVPRLKTSQGTSEKVRPRLIESSNGSLLIVFNDQSTDQSAALQLPSRYKRAVNIYSKQSQTIQDGAIEVQGRSKW
jgi:hypothetical protein